MYENIINMLARLHPNMLPGAMWVASPTVLPQLLSMQFSVYDGTPAVVGGSQVSVPAGNGTEAGQYNLMGLPLAFSEALPVVGDAGEYLLGVRQDTQIMVSQHLKFDEDKTVFRLILRADGQGRWNAPVTRLYGNTLSWCVVLEARS